MKAREVLQRTLSTSSSFPSKAEDGEAAPTVVLAPDFEQWIEKNMSDLAKDQKVATKLHRRMSSRGRGRSPVPITRLDDGSGAMHEIQGVRRRYSMASVCSSTNAGSSSASSIFRPGAPIDHESLKKSRDKRRGRSRSPLKIVKSAVKKVKGKGSKKSSGLDKELHDYPYINSQTIRSWGTSATSSTVGSFDGNDSVSADGTTRAASSEVSTPVPSGVSPEPTCATTTIVEEPAETNEDDGCEKEALVPIGLRRRASPQDMAVALQLGGRNAKPADSIRVYKERREEAAPELPNYGLYVVQSVGAFRRLILGISDVMLDRMKSVVWGTVRAKVHQHHQSTARITRAAKSYRSPQQIIRIVQQKIQKQQRRQSKNLSSKLSHYDQGQTDRKSVV